MMGVGGWGKEGGRNDDEDDDDDSGGAAVPTRREALNTHGKCIFVHLTQAELSPMITHLVRAVSHRIQFFIMINNMMI